MKKYKGYLFLFNTIFFFSTFEVVSKTMTGQVDPLQLNFLRFFIGGLFILPFIFASKQERSRKLNVYDFLYVLLLGFINITLSMNFLQMSLTKADASVVAVIFSSNPIYVSIFSVLILREGMTLRKFAAFLLGIAGIVVCFGGRLIFDSGSVAGTFLAVLSAVLFALNTVLGKKVAGKIGVMKTCSYSFITGSLLFLPVMIIKKIPIIYIDVSCIPKILYLSVFVTGLAYVTYFLGLKLVETGKGSMIFFFKPVIAGILAATFLGEKITFSLAAGAAMIILSLLVYNSNGYGSKATAIQQQQ